MERHGADPVGGLGTPSARSLAGASRGGAKESQRPDARQSEKGRKKTIEGYIKKRIAHFDVGRVGIMVDDVFGRRMGLGVVGEVLQPDGVESVGSEEVTMTLHEHFRARFVAEGGQWHTDKEVDRAMRASLTLMLGP